MLCSSAGTDATNKNMKRLCLLVCFLVPFLGSATDIPITAWTVFSPRDEIAPRCVVDREGGRSRDGALKISAAGNPGAFGGWTYKVPGIEGGNSYRFIAWYRAKDIPHERRSIIARLEWQDARGHPLRPPDYALDQQQKAGAWTKVELITPVPTNANQVKIELAMGFAENGTVWWDDIALEKESSPPNRIVRAATLYCRPRGTKSAAESVEKFCALAEQTASQHPDVICLPEGITVVGNGKSYADVSEPVPGPTCERLSKLAKTLHSYIVAGIYERDQQIVYNTAVLIGRDGKLVGKYRKTHLPREEWEAGITPGDSYPVFTTDFGKVGLTVCWDVQFPEPCRAMALKGAELILLPIWGGSDILARARAIENHVFLISSSYDMKSFIVDPTGKVLAEATQSAPVAFAELRLDEKIFQPWLGDMKNRTWKERRSDIPVE
jgi:predicted amidohydrolase